MIKSHDMKKILLLFAGLCAIQISGAQSHTPAGDSLNLLIRPFLDSLRVDSSIEDLHTLRLYSLFPASRAVDARFDNFSQTGLLTSFVPENDRLTGRTTEPFAIFGGMRLALIYSLYQNNYTDEIALNAAYTFTSRAETALGGEKMIRQTLTLTALSDDDQITGGDVETVIYQPDTDAPIEIGRPVYRIVDVHRDDVDPGLATHFIRDADGVLHTIDISEGSDRTLPSFKGGRLGAWIYALREMKYPPEALEKNMSADVLVQMTITARGKVKDIEFMSEPDPVFRKEALRLARKSSGKWIPATRNGENIDDETVWPIQFDSRYAPKW